jgi:hypothetical protein
MIEYNTAASGGFSSISMYRRAAFILVLAVGATSVYRAATQSITFDEAWFFNRFLRNPSWLYYGPYDASHHVLFSMLSMASVKLFGIHEFALRLPALLGGFLYLAVVLRLSRHACGDGPLLLLSVSLLSLNPLLMDFMCIARGYGLALGLWLWSLYQVVLFFKSPERRRVRNAAICLAGAVSANLTFLIPALSLAAILSLVLLLDERYGGAETLAKRCKFAVVHFVIPGILTAGVILVPPLWQAHLDAFYVGTSSVADSLRSLAVSSLFQYPASSWIARTLPGLERFWFPLLGVLVPVVFATAFVKNGRSIYSWLKQRSFRRLDANAQFQFVAGGSLLGSAILVGAQCATFRTPFPEGRTGLYFIPLFVFTVLSLWLYVRKNRQAAVVIGLPLAFLAALSLAHLIAGFRTSYYGQWIFDSSSKRIAQVIRQRHGDGPAPQARIGADWIFVPALEFYRVRYKLEWIEGEISGNPDGAFDYYVLDMGLPKNEAIIASKMLTALYSDSLSKALLAVPSPAVNKH